MNRTHRRIAAATVVFPLLIAGYARAEAVKADDPRLMTETVTFKSVTGDVKAYLARPKDDAKHPGVLVVHELTGLSANTQDNARHLAVEGYVVLAPDFLSPIGGTQPPAARGGRGAGSAPPAGGGRFALPANRLKPEETYANGIAAVAYLRSRPDVTDKVGVVGFTWGGRVAQHMAVMDSKLDAVVAYFGQPPSLADAPKLNAPLLMLYADVMLDMHNGGEGSLYAQELKRLGKTYAIYFQQGAQLRFNNDTNAAAYNETAANLAWSRSIAWLKKYLG